MPHVCQCFAVIRALTLLVAGQPTSVAGQGDESNHALNSLTSVVQPERGFLEWHFKGRKLLTYSFASNQFKPYVRELFTLAGDNVLRDAPADHLHHHGLMYAIRVNGVNFWEEVDQPGHERHVKLLAQSTGRSANGFPQASFTELIHWVPHGERAQSDTPDPFLIERRTLTPDGGSGQP